MTIVSRYPYWIDSNGTMGREAKAKGQFGNLKAAQAGTAPATTRRKHMSCLRFVAFGCQEKPFFFIFGRGLPY